MTTAYNKAESKDLTYTSWVIPYGLLAFGGLATASSTIRSPDVLQAELAVRAANARVGIASTAFFPQIGLTALLGRASSPLEAFAPGANSLWSTAASLSGPIYEGGLLRAQKRQAIANWEEIRVAYERAALVAFRDVSNAVVTTARNWKKSASAKLVPSRPIVKPSKLRCNATQRANPVTTKCWKSNRNSFPPKTPWHRPNRAAAWP